MKKPEIKIQLIHLDGPFKGQIAEYLSEVVTFGRHPDCHVVFPEDLRGISRRHAEIRREGNRFLLRDTSTNGTQINGQQLKETILKSGDVLIFGPGGPKISFLTAIVTEDEASSIRAEGEPPPEAASVMPPPSPVSFAAPVNIPLPARQQPPPGFAPSVQSRSFAVPKEKTSTPLVIQYGAQLKVFKTLPITLGKGSQCDYPIEHAAILERHAQVFFDQGQYWVQDLTGRNLLTVNTQVVQAPTPLLPDMHLSLSPQGPKFQFLEGGRLVEVTAPQGAPQGAGHIPMTGPLQAAPQERQRDGGRNTVLIVGGILALIVAVGLVVLLLQRYGTQLREFISPFLRG
ncbi:MAG: hypothetical protein BWK76_01285 [Desulfobulbaceae bacterium A2]|nr:MAG: hypothetical protein BWK76_01285 [Desulfobulbaceae bacterium A2]